MIEPEYDCDDMGTSSEQISQEQAGEVAEWLGMYYIGFHSCHHWFLQQDEDKTGMYDDLICHTDALIDWLYSPEGQEAVRDKLGSLVIRDYCSPACGVSEWWEITLTKRGRRAFTGDYHLGGATAKTRQHALLLAVLEIIKEKK